MDPLDPPANVPLAFEHLFPKEREGKNKKAVEQFQWQWPRQSALGVWTPHSFFPRLEAAVLGDWLFSHPLVFARIIFASRYVTGARVICGSAGRGNNFHSAL